MTKKDFLLPLGEGKMTPVDTDVLLSSKISERKRKEIERQEEADEAAHRAKMARLNKETTVADGESEKVERKSGDSSEPAFKLTGGVKLDIDPVRDQREAREAAERVSARAAEAKEKTDEEIKRLTVERDEKARELQDNKLTTVMREMTGSFNSALKTMNEKLEEVRAGADPTTMVSQFKVLSKLSEEIASMRGTPAVGDSALQLEITKLEMSNARAEREFQARLAQEARQWDLEKIKLEDDRHFRKQEADRQQRKDDMFANAPAAVGSAIAKGMMDAEGANSISKAPKSKVGQHVEAGVGESGEFECSSCGHPVAIGATARAAVCSSCETRFPIERKQPETGPEIEPEEE